MFELTDDIKTPTMFIESDPYNHGYQAQIVLEIDWKDNTANLNTVYRDGSIPFSVYNGLISWYNLPGDVDAVAFIDYYNEEIRPNVEELGKYYESIWDGHNWVGTFIKYPQKDEYDEEMGAKNDDWRWGIEMAIVDACHNAPCHDFMIVSDIYHVILDPRDILDFLNDETLRKFLNGEYNDDEEIYNEIVDDLTFGYYLLYPVTTDQLDEFREDLLEYMEDDLNERNQ